MAKIPTSREEKRGTERREAPGGGGVLFWPKRKRERGRWVFLNPTTLNPKD